MNCVTAEHWVVDSIVSPWIPGENMLENTSLDTLIEQQIKLAVEQRVQAVLDQTTWIDQIEQRIVDYVQNRIVARFSNIQTVPDLIQTVQTSVAKLFDQGHVPDLSQYVDHVKLTQAVDSGIQVLVDNTINNLVIDPVWINKIENLVNQNMTQQFSRKLSDLDINNLLISTIDAGIDRWQDRLKKDFCTNGIVDKASTIELTVMDGVVVVENDFVAKQIQVTDNLSVNNLIVSGVINTDNRSWNELKDMIKDQVLLATTDQWRKDLVDQVVAQAETAGINFDSVMINNEPLINNNTLSSTVVDSHLQSTGILKNLQVSGTAQFGQTMQVSGRRVGINTQDPEMALSVWDEEVSVIAGKLSKQQAFVGTARLQNLAIGVNRIPQIEIDTEGLTTIKQLRVGRHRISHATSVPGYSGTRGDLVLNSDPKPDTPFAWVCLGAFQWQSLHSAR
jgi:hypothetical protein